MKRCPQCEFIYEDDQSLCDMDGILLVFDSKQLPRPRVSAAPSRSSHWRNRIVTAFAAIVLAAVLGLVYYVSTNQQRANQPTPVTTGQPSMKASAAATKSEPPKTQSETRNDAEVKETKVSSAEASPKSALKGSAEKSRSNVSPAAAKREAEKKTKAKSASTQKAQSSTQTKKDDSKIGSLLKKTGRLLKKPFRF